MKRIDMVCVGVLVGVLLLLYVLACSAAPDWQDQRSQTTREDWRFRNAAGVVTIDNGYRAFIAGADSSLIGNQVDFTASAACSCYYAVSMRTGAPIRAGRFDIYKISPGADSLVYDNAYINGRLLGRYAVDDTTLAPLSVSTGALKDSCVTSGKLATNLAVAGDLTVGGTLTAPTLADLTSPLTVHAALTAHSVQVDVDANIDGSCTVDQGLIVTQGADIDTITATSGLHVANHLTVGDGTTGSSILLNATINATGQALTAGAIAGTTISGSGNITAGDATSDSLTGLASVNHRSGYLKLGTAGIAGQIVMSDGTANTITATAPETATNTTWAFPSFMKADTLVLKTTRTLWADRSGSKYMAGAKAGDVVVMGSVGVNPVTLILTATTDSIQVVWGSTTDSKVVPFLVIRQ